MELEDIVEVNAEKLGGTPVFAGTRVPIKNLFDYLEGGESLDAFLEDFPTVAREQVIGLLESIRERLLKEYERAA